jgi:ATP-dependent protease ClpP protease subunit
MQEILLYNSIYQSSAANFINQLEAAKDTDVVVRMNTDGGSPEDMWGMVAKMKERTKKTLVKVDGRAHSSGLYACCMAKDVECLNVSTFILHRAAYGEWIEKSADRFTQSMKDGLNTINSLLRNCFESKIDVSKFEALKGVTLDEVFSLDSRIDVELNASEALAIGLVNRVVNITSSIQNEINSYCDRLGIAAYYTSPIEAQTKIVEPKIMKTIAEFKAAHPELFAQVQLEAVEAERDRVGSFMAFSEIDPVAVKAGIESGKPMSATQMSAFSLKAIQANALATLPTTPTPVAAAPEAEVTEAEKSKSAFLAEAADGLKVSADKYTDINVG